MKAKSIHGSSIEEISLAFQQSREDGFTPTLAIVFISIKQDREAVRDLLRNQNIDIIGATSAGEFIGGHQSSEAMVILLLDIRKEQYAVIFKETTGKTFSEAAKEIANKALSLFANPAFILCSTSFTKEGIVLDGFDLLQNLERTLGTDKIIFGGMAGDDASFTGTCVFTGDQSTDYGFVLLVLDNDKIEVQGMAMSGWKPLGKIRTVTESKDGWLYSIDGQPALEMYLRYLGQTLGEEGNDQKKFIDGVGLYHPFLSINAGDPVLRTPFAMDREKNAIKLDFPIPEGKELQFTLPPDFDIVESVLENARDRREKVKSDADALLIFSCYGRLSALGPMVQEENDGLQQIWNAPMAGFFTYGEYGKDQSGLHEFHSTTCSWVVLKEK
ncbi:MAG: FIST C-terminal domain-containing protein [Chitinophagaceae bacterium]|nr:FIST C-terminal domain-containing protein [Chitinophagaceae bacterium]MBP8243741.1 FIST C-terminal domain-containing protein [Chitinophagaceae bacterium]